MRVTIETFKTNVSMSPNVLALLWQQKDFTDQDAHKYQMLTHASVDFLKDKSE